MAKLLLFSDFSKITEIVCGSAYLDKWHTAKPNLLWHCYTPEERKASTSKMWAFSAIFTHKDWHQPAIHYSLLKKVFKMTHKDTNTPSLDYGRLAPDFVEGLHLDSYTMTAFAEVIWEGCISPVNQIKDTENIARHSHLFTCLLVGLYMHYRLIGFSDDESQKAAFGYLNSKDFEVPYIALLPVEMKDLFREIKS